MGVVSEITRRESHSNLPDPLALAIFLAPSCTYLRLRYGICFVDLFTVTRRHNSAFVVFWNMLHMLEGESSLMRVKDYTYLCV